MSAVSVSLFSPAGPDLTNATTAEIITDIFKAFGTRPFVPEDSTTCNPMAVKPSELNAWLVAHGCRRLQWRDFLHDQFELVEVTP